MENQRPNPAPKVGLKRWPGTLMRPVPRAFLGHRPYDSYHVLEVRTNNKKAFHPQAQGRKTSQEVAIIIHQQSERVRKIQGRSYPLYRAWAGKRGSMTRKSAGDSLLERPQQMRQQLLFARQNSFQFEQVVFLHRKTDAPGQLASPGYQ